MPLADIRRDLGLSRAETQADLSLLNLVNHGGGTYLLSAEIDGDAVVVDREPGGEAMAGPARLSPLMARALLLALDVVGDALPSETRADLDSVRARVEASLGGVALPGPVEMEDLVPADSDIVGTLNRALRDRRVVRLEYYTPSREALSERLVEPGLLYHSGDAWYLEAYCLRAGRPAHLPAGPDPLRGRDRRHLRDPPGDGPIGAPRGSAARHPAACLPGLGAVPSAPAASARGAGVRRRGGG